MPVRKAPDVNRQPATNLPELLSVATVATELSITERQARELFTRRVFALVRLGRRLYVRRDVLAAYLDAQAIPARTSDR